MARIMIETSAGIKAVNPHGLITLNRTCEELIDLAAQLLPTPPVDQALPIVTNTGQIIFETRRYRQQDVDIAQATIEARLKRDSKS